tara:strand:+ start:188 stop:298 length:111 start_codon:yes stop_codon:yes gene_type:complete
VQRVNYKKIETLLITIAVVEVIWGNAVLIALLFRGD